jgi:hypothetical protein
MGHGGKRPGAGAKKGSKRQSTITKEQAREALRQIVLREMDALVAAQLHNAKGLHHFFLKDQRGKFVQITDPKLIEAALNSGEEGRYYWIHTKDPSVQAFTDLMNRALDKPAEQKQEIDLNVSGELNLVDRLQAARKRLSDARRAKD